MRVYNLTDVPTSAISARGLVNANLGVGGVVIAPGEHADVPKLSADDQAFVRCGALAVGEPPAWYRSKKAVTPEPTVVEPPTPVEEEPSSPPVDEENEHTAETLVPGTDPPPKPSGKGGKSSKKRRGSR